MRDTWSEWSGRAGVPSVPGLSCHETEPGARPGVSPGPGSGRSCTGVRGQSEPELMANSDLPPLLLHQAGPGPGTIMNTNTAITTHNNIQVCRLWITSISHLKSIAKMNLLWLQVYSLYQSRGCLWLQLESWDHVTRVQPPVETRPHDYLLPTSIQSQTMKKISCSSGIKFTSGYFFFL